eukprot:scaffold188629_cov20-Cyclotella_meneghiniana.AAC.1
MSAEVIPDIPLPNSMVPPVLCTPSNAAICRAHASFVGLPHRLYTNPSSSVKAASFLSCNRAP